MSVRWKTIKKNRVKKVRYQAAAAFIIIAAAALLIFFVPRWSRPARTELADGFVGEGYAVIGENIQKRLQGEDMEFRASEELAGFSADSGMYTDGDNYYLKKSSKGSNFMINPGFPLFMNEGTYTYLYHDKFVLVTDSFDAIEGKTGVYLANGMVFNRENKREGDETILMLRLPGGLYINAMEITLETGNETTVIPMNSIIRFSDSGADWCVTARDSTEFHSAGVSNSMVMIECGGVRLTYGYFVEKLCRKGTAGDSDEQEALHVDEELYQFFLGQRYDYKESKTFYRTSDGYLMETEGERFLVYQAPFYYTSEKKLLIPCDYVLVQPKLSMMNRLPAMSAVWMDEMALYTDTAGTMKTFADMFLFDGSDGYIFFEAITIKWGKESVAVSPMSHVTMENDGTLGIYDYENNEQRFYQTNGQKDIYAVLGSGMSAGLFRDVLYSRNGQEELLFSDPSLLTQAD